MIRERGRVGLGPPSRRLDVLDSSKLTMISFCCCEGLNCTLLSFILVPRFETKRGTTT